MHEGKPSFFSVEIRISLKTLSKADPTSKKTAAVYSPDLNDLITLVYRMVKLSMQDLFLRNPNFDSENLELYSSHQLRRLYIIFSSILNIQEASEIGLNLSEERLGMKNIKYFFQSGMNFFFINTSLNKSRRKFKPSIERAFMTL